MLFVVGIYLSYRLWIACQLRAACKGLMTATLQAAKSPRFLSFLHSVLFRFERQEFVRDVLGKVQIVGHDDLRHSELFVLED